MVRHDLELRPDGEATVQRGRRLAADQAVFLRQCRHYEVRSPAHRAHRLRAYVRGSRILGQREGSSVHDKVPGAGLV